MGNTSAKQDARIQDRSLQSDSATKPPEAYSSWRPPLPSAPRSADVLVGSARARQDTGSLEKPPEAPRSSKPSPSFSPSTKLSASPLPSAKASLSSPLLSKASPSLPSKVPPIPQPKASPPPLPSLKTSPSPPLSSNASPAPRPPSKAPSYPIPSSNPAEYVDRSPELSTIKQKSMLPRYEIPKHLKDLIQKDKVPPVLRSPLSPSTYADYFAALLYAEDFYIEKWSNFLLSEVTLELRSRVAFENSRGPKKINESVQMNKKDFVAFVIDSVPERRPFLLSRDFVFVRPSGKKTEPFKGILFCVVKSTMVLVEFEDDFHAQHLPTKKYDVSFSFNRVCLKRCHHAVSAAMDPSLHNMLFPEQSSSSSFLYSPPFATPSDGNLKQGISRILNHKGSLPYLIKGPLSTTSDHLSRTGYVLSRTGSVLQEASLQIYRTAPHCRILICAPRNQTCDELIKSLHNEIPKSDLFRANAAFRDYDLVPDDIIPACLYEGECFTCPPLSQLQNFKVITSTFMSSFRIHNAGINADHFTHLFLVDASSAMEPEAVIALANLVGRKTVVVVTGSSEDFPRLVRADIARRHGLKKSYFHRLLEREPYLSRDPRFITHLM